MPALAGCGSGGGSTTVGAAAPTVPPASAPTVTATVPIATATTPTAPAQPSTSPESQPGGAGDETPIATQVLFTGEGGDITPATVHVSPFIAVNVILHSKDGDSYAIEVAHHTLNVDSGRRTASVRLEGLRRGKRYAVEVVGAPERLSIVANAEPGP